MSGGVVGALLAASWLLAGPLTGCGERPKACSASAECPQNTACVQGLCQHAPFADAAGDAADDAHPCAPAPSGPGPRSAATGGVVGGRLLLLGGDEGPAGRCAAGSMLATDAWIHERCKGWRKAAIDPLAPGPREGAATAVDLQAGKLYAFGGRSRGHDTGNWLLLGDLRVYDRATGKWALLAGDAGSPVAYAAMALDPPRDRLLLVGGDAAAEPGAHRPLGLVREFSRKTRHWQLSFALGAPPARSRHAVAVAKGGLFVLGGLLKGGALARRMWRLDLASDTWQSYALVGIVPTPRVGAALVAVPGTAMVVLFGGEDVTPPIGRNDLWRLDAGALTWKRLLDGDLGPDGVYNRFPALPGEVSCKAGGAGGAVKPGWLEEAGAAPPRRAFAVSGWDADHRELIVAGGRGDCGPLADVWALSTVSWTWAALAPDPAGWSCPRRHPESDPSSPACRWLCAP